MRVATYLNNGAPAVGLVAGESILDLTAACERFSAAPAPMSVLALIAGGEAAVAKASAALEKAKGHVGDATLWRPLSEVRLLAPIPRPAKNVFCTGRNYKLHIEEGAREQGIEVKFPPVPEFFTKPPTAVIGPEAEIRLDTKLTKALDYEVEFAIVIGQECRDVKASEALDVVFGYTVLNDVSARDLQRAHGQWFKGKALDTSCPIGPWIVTADEFGSPNDVRLSLRVNGETRQDSTTADLLFDCATIIESLSQGLTLEPGDIICTGTPSGVGYAMKPPALLKDGDIVEAEVAGIGVLRNTVRAVA
jgi:2-keto-4-pentenoate hydratase/2-oxohepta-3-ene-1,7-dioic acid hydratase in catechol pathway